jgi:hypothetical protein
LKKDVLTDGKEGGILNGSIIIQDYGKRYKKDIIAEIKEIPEHEIQQIDGYGIRFNQQHEQNF